MNNAFLRHFANDLCLIAPSGLAFLPDPARAEAALAYARELAKFHAQPTDQAAESEFRKHVRKLLEPKAQMTDDGIAILPIEGPLAYAPDVWDMYFSGLEDSRSIERMIRGAGSDPFVKGIMLKIHSPGGSVMGGAEIASAVKTAGLRKPVVAHTGGMMASLSYWIGSQASAGLFATESAYVGSIGVLSTVTDVSKYLDSLGIKVEVFTNREAKFKAIGAQGTSLSDDGRDHLRERADAIFAQFRDGVLSARPQVPASSMQGQVFVGKDAKTAGLVDAIGSFDYAMAHLRRRIPAV
jgi:signal peptide peptidase SppA